MRNAPSFIYNYNFLRKMDKYDMAKAQFWHVSHQSGTILSIHPAATMNSTDQQGCGMWYMSGVEAPLKAKFRFSFLALYLMNFYMMKMCARTSKHIDRFCVGKTKTGRNYTSNDWKTAKHLTVLLDAKRLERADLGFVVGCASPSGQVCEISYLL